MSLHVYVAGPMSKPDLISTARTGIQYADVLVDHGFVPYVPHLSVFWAFLSPRDYEDWLRLDFAWIEKCEALFRIPGESPGADREVAFAESKGIPVFTSIAAILEWRKSR